MKLRDAITLDIVNRRAEIAAAAAERAATAGAPAPEREPAPVNGAAFVAEVAEVLSRITPATAAQARARTFAASIAPRIAACGWPARFLVERAEWGCEPQRETFEDCRRLFQRTGAIVALIGARGTGKTTIGAQLAIARMWEDWERACAGGPFTFRDTPFEELSSLIARFKPLYADFGTTKQEELAAARAGFVACDLAVIDELHECDDLRIKNRVLTSLLNLRYAARTDTLIISNQTAEDFQSTTDDSVLSRISEHGAIITCTWPSWREVAR